MLSINQEIINILKANNIDWQSKPQLAKDILKFAQEMKLEQLQDSFVNTTRLKEPIDCPLCTQNIAVEEIPLEKLHGILLIKACWLTHNGKPMLDVTQDMGLNTETEIDYFFNLQHWGLIIIHSKTIFTVTEPAMYFIGQQLQLPKNVYVYNQRLVSKHRELVDVVNIIGNFDKYKELMEKTY